MQTAISFLLDGQAVTIDFPAQGWSPTTTVLRYLRSLSDHRGVKEGCGEGDCGACTVVTGELSGEILRYRAVNSCLVFLPMLHGKQLITVENLKRPDGTLHPVQQAMIDGYGSQCGFCTPGVVMSLFALYQNATCPEEEDIRRALAGNLCRCTGYRPIVDAARKACRDGGEPDPARAIGQLKAIPRESLVLTGGGQTYFRPASLREALELKSLHPDAIVLNGATDIAHRLTRGHEVFPFILDLSGIGELRGSSEEEDAVVLGGGITMEDLSTFCRETFPAIFDMLKVFGSLQIRNLATLGGNLMTASPVGDLLPLLIAHGGRIILESTRGEREVMADRFLSGYRRTVAADDELLTAVVLPRLRRETIIRSYKVSRRRDVDIATVSGGFRLELENGARVRNAVLAYGGMADCVRRALTAEAYLKGKVWNRQTVEEAMERIDTDFTPISDVRGSAAMRRLAAKNLLLKFWVESAGNGGEPWS